MTELREQLLLKLNCYGTPTESMFSCLELGCSLQKCQEKSIGGLFFHFLNILNTPQNITGVVYKEQLIFRLYKILWAILEKHWHRISETLYSKEIYDRDGNYVVVSRNKNHSTYATANANDKLINIMESGDNIFIQFLNFKRDEDVSKKCSQELCFDLHILTASKHILFEYFTCKNIKQKCLLYPIEMKYSNSKKALQRKATNNAHKHDSSNRNTSAPPRQDQKVSTTDRVINPKQAVHKQDLQTPPVKTNNDKKIYSKLTPLFKENEFIFKSLHPNAQSKPGNKKSTFIRDFGQQFSGQNRGNQMSRKCTQPLQEDMCEYGMRKSKHALSIKSESPESTRKHRETADKITKSETTHIPTREHEAGFNKRKPESSSEEESWDENQSRQFESKNSTPDQFENPNDTGRPNKFKPLKLWKSKNNKTDKFEDPKDTVEPNQLKVLKPWKAKSNTPDKFEDSRVMPRRESDINFEPERFTEKQIWNENPRKHHKVPEDRTTRKERIRTTRSDDLKIEQSPPEYKTKKPVRNARDDYIQKMVYYKLHSRLRPSSSTSSQLILTGTIFTEHAPQKFKFTSPSPVLRKISYSRIRKDPPMIHQKTQENKSITQKSSNQFKTGNKETYQLQDKLNYMNKLQFYRQIRNIRYVITPLSCGLSKHCGAEDEITKDRKGNTLKICTCHNAQPQELDATRVKPKKHKSEVEIWTKNNNQLDIAENNIKSEILEDFFLENSEKPKIILHVQAAFTNVANIISQLTVTDLPRRANYRDISTQYAEEQQSALLHFIFYFIVKLQWLNVKLQIQSEAVIKYVRKPLTVTSLVHFDSSKFLDTICSPYFKKSPQSNIVTIFPNKLQNIRRQQSIPGNSAAFCKFIIACKSNLLRIISIGNQITEKKLANMTTCLFSWPSLLSLPSYKQVTELKSTCAKLTQNTTFSKHNHIWAFPISINNFSRKKQLIPKIRLESRRSKLPISLNISSCSRHKIVEEEYETTHKDNKVNNLLNKINQSQIVEDAVRHQESIYQLPILESRTLQDCSYEYLSQELEYQLTLTNESLANTMSGESNKDISLQQCQHFNSIKSIIKKIMSNKKTEIPKLQPQIESFSKISDKIKSDVQVDNVLTESLLDIQSKEVSCNFWHKPPLYIENLLSPINNADSKHTISFLCKPPLYKQNVLSSTRKRKTRFNENDVKNFVSLQTTKNPINITISDSNISNQQKSLASKPKKTLRNKLTTTKSEPELYSETISLPTDKDICDSYFTGNYVTEELNKDICSNSKNNHFRNEFETTGKTDTLLDCIEFYEDLPYISTFLLSPCTNDEEEYMHFGKNDSSSTDSEFKNICCPQNIVGIPSEKINISHILQKCTDPRLTEENVRSSELSLYTTLGDRSNLLTPCHSKQNATTCLSQKKLATQVITSKSICKITPDVILRKSSRACEEPGISFLILKANAMQTFMHEITFELD